MPYWPGCVSSCRSKYCCTNDQTHGEDLAEPREKNKQVMDWYKIEGVIITWLREGNNLIVDTNTKYSIETHGTFQVHSLPNRIYIHTCARASTLLLLLPLRYLGPRRENNGQP